MARVLIAMLLTVVAVTAAPAAERVVATTLPNGLRVLLLEDHRSPLVSFQLWYRVGSRNEARGATGLAHFLEHMMFKGTAKHGPREFARLVEEQGGRDNAFTTQDVTSYFVDIASKHVDLVVGLEADRMQNLLLDPREFESERQVVIEERRMRTEDNPAGFLGEEINSLAFKAHPYGAPIIGWMDDIKRVTIDELRAFYKTYYVPNNALVVAVGDFDATRLLARITAEFGTIPRGPDPPPVTTVEPPPNGERRTIVRKQAQLPIIEIAYHVPNYRSDDAAALDLLSSILAVGRASRIYRHLVHERQLALDAGGDYSYLAFDPNLFWFWATPLPGQTPETLERELLAEADRFRKEPVTDEELARARNQIEAEFVFQQDSVHRRASLLARFELIGGYALEDTYLSRIRAVTAADITRVAQRWFDENKKSVGILLPLP